MIFYDDKVKYLTLKNYLYKNNLFLLKIKKNYYIKKNKELNLRENQLKKLHINEIIETSHNKANEIRDLCKTKN